MSCSLPLWVCRKRIKIGIKFEKYFVTFCSVFTSLISPVLPLLPLWDIESRSSWQLWLTAGLWLHQLNRSDRVTLLHWHTVTLSHSHRHTLTLWHRHTLTLSHCHTLTVTLSHSHTVTGVGATTSLPGTHHHMLVWRGGARTGHVCATDF